MNISIAARNFKRQDPLLKSLSHPSVITLILTNLITIAAAYYFGWELADLLWVYFGQSLIIGVFQFLKILDLDKFSTEGVRINGKRPPANTVTRRYLAFFFLFHYGFFHFIYFIFLTVLFHAIVSSIQQLVLMTVLFFVNHLVSYLSNRASDRKRVPNIGTLFFLPYFRIFPMHLVLLFCIPLGSGGALFLFLILRMLADVYTHLLEHTISGAKRFGSV